MQTTKNNNQKENSTVQTVETKNNQKDASNLEKLLQNINLPEKGVNAKESIYKDDSYLKSFDGGKSFRTKKRKALNRLAITFIQQVKASNKEEIKKSFESFNVFYKETYKRNDFTLSSIYGGKENSNEFIFLQQFLNVVAECKKEKLI